MADEQAIQSQLVQQFPFLEGKVRHPRERRLFVEAPAERAREVFDFLVGKMDFSILCTITGLDQGENLCAMYHLARPGGEVLNLSVSVPKTRPVLQTVSGVFPAADAYERELVDLLGFEVQGLPPGNRYPLPDGWPQGMYPLRKEWKAEMLEGVMCDPAGTKEPKHG